MAWYLFKMIEETEILKNPHQTVAYWTDALDDEAVGMTSKTLFYLCKDIMILKAGSRWQAERVEMLGRSRDFALEYTPDKNIIDELLHIEEFGSNNNRYLHTIRKSLHEDEDIFRKRTDLRKPSEAYRIKGYLNPVRMKALAQSLWWSFLASTPGFEKDAHIPDPDSINPN
jgi:hypothetical protein